MLSAALYELLTEEQKKEYLEKINSLGLAGVTVFPEKSEKCGITGTHMTVLIDGEEELDIGHEHEHAEKHGHEHSHVHADEHIDNHESEYIHNNRSDHHHDAPHHNHHHTSLQHIRKTIDAMPTPLSHDVKAGALEIYDLLADAESHSHGVPAEEIHFHEVGEKDAIVDIISVCLLMDLLKPDKVVASPVAVGSGTVRCAHGILPVPAPATAFILQQAKIPCYAGYAAGELLTPTGAALLRHFVTEFGKMPAMTIGKTGYGMGRKDFEQANCVRAILGTEIDTKVPGTEYASGDSTVPGTCIPSGNRSAPADNFTDRISELSCNLDDMTPEDIAFAEEQLFSAGALDVFTTSIGMKKNRPGIMLTALCHEGQKAAVVKSFFRYTTTLGVREKICGRYIMKSRSTHIDMSGKRDGTDAPDFAGENRIPQAEAVKVKISEGYGEKRAKPEFDQIAEIARRDGRPTAEIRREVLRKYTRKKDGTVAGASVSW